MSISASIDLKLFQKTNDYLSAIDIIKLMINNGWRIESNKKIAYLPLGDDGMYDWQERELSKTELFEILLQKEQKKEVIGIDFFWDSTETGISMLFFPDDVISFNISINRLKIDLPAKIDITDVSWYLKRILPCFITDDIVVERFSFYQN